MGKLYFLPTQRFHTVNFILGGDREGTAGVMEKGRIVQERHQSGMTFVWLHTKAVKTTCHELMDIGLPSLLYVHTHLLNMNGRDLALILIMNTLMMMWFSIFTWTSKA
jgi:hypothetical protein